MLQRGTGVTALRGQGNMCHGDHVMTSWRERMSGRNPAPAVDHPGLRWWREARFGMFIHWGIYAVAAGRWEGEHVPGIGEWIMHHRRIPRDVYAQLAERFEPVDYDADEWVRLAADAGMRYLVITAKHHDGFAMFRSPCCPYNIVDTTPWGRDPIAPLAEACQKHGIRLGFYYSQDQDWHDPDGTANDWDFDERAKDFGAYLERKVKPQLHELLTQYGPIGLIWFDTPYSISPEHSRELARYVHDLQPDCLVSGRIGNDVGDYGSLGDNQIPAGIVTGDYETPATINDTWAHKVDDDNWKSTPELVRLLVDLASKGVNYLLNVGPTASGRIPQPSVDRLRELGQWLAPVGDAIYGTKASPFPFELPRVRITRSDDRLFLFLVEPPAEGSLAVHGLRSRVGGATLLATGDAIDVKQDQISGGIDRLQLDFGATPTVQSNLVPVVAIELVEPLAVDTRPLQQHDGSITLHAHVAEVERAASSELEVLSPGVTAGWFDTDSGLRWELVAHTAGHYRAHVVVFPNHQTTVVPPHRLSLEIAEQTIEGALVDPRPAHAHEDARTRYFPEFEIDFGEITITEPGPHRATLRVTQAQESPDGVTFLNVVLRPT